MFDYLTYTLCHTRNRYASTQDSVLPAERPVGEWAVHKWPIVTERYTRKTQTRRVYKNVEYPSQRAVTHQGRSVAGRPTEPVDAVT